MQGYIVKVHPKGFGFFRPSEGGRDVYLPHRIVAANPGLKIGDCVDVDVNDRGAEDKPFAIALRLIDQAA